jgi:hypothetical protein
MAPAKAHRYLVSFGKPIEVGQYLFPTAIDDFTMSRGELLNKYWAPRHQADSTYIRNC